MIEAKDLLLPLFAALWGATTLVFSATTAANKMRDDVIAGHNGVHRLSAGHRRQIMVNDWLPMVLNIIFVCLGFATVAGAVPWMLEAEPGASQWPPRVIVGFVTVYSAGLAVIWIFAGLSDWRAMRTACETALETSPSDVNPH